MSFRFADEAHQLNVNMTVIDTAGLEQYRSIVPQPIRQSDYCYLCYALDSQKSLDGLEAWLDIIKANNQNIKIVLVGTKLDVAGDLDEGVIEKNRSSFYKHVRCSAKTGENMEQLIELDFD